MADDQQNKHELGYYAMIQIGLEMAAPIAVGFWLDSNWTWFPCLTVSGVVFGFSLGLLEISRIGSGKDSSDHPRKPPGAT